MEIVYFTLVAILLYLLADWILRRIEAYLGRVLKQRTVVFFVILLILAMVSFAAIRAYVGQQHRPSTTDGNRLTIVKNRIDAAVSVLSTSCKIGEAADLSAGSTCSPGRSRERGYNHDRRNQGS
ncbi:MAG: hypothetical protein Q8P46_12385 [Hyphomicrobiales bacterium]|nr:hypothetical protein [Hyphomicrobiales bacterium]